VFGIYISNLNILVAQNITCGLNNNNDNLFSFGACFYFSEILMIDLISILIYYCSSVGYSTGIQMKFSILSSADYTVFCLFECL